jgi:hypothetical protein
MEETLTVTRLGITGKLKAHPPVDQPLRIGDLHRPRHPPQRQALVLPATCACAGPPQGCSKPKPASARSRATAAWPPWRSRSSTTCFVSVNLTVTHQPKTRQQLHYVTFTPGTAANVNFHDERDNLGDRTADRRPRLTPRHYYARSRPRRRPDRRASHLPNRILTTLATGHEARVQALGRLAPGARAHVSGQ